MGDIPVAVYVMLVILVLFVARVSGLVDWLLGGNGRPAQPLAGGLAGRELAALKLEYPELPYNPMFTGAPRVDRQHVQVRLELPPEEAARRILQGRHVDRHELIERGWVDGQVVPKSRAEARLVSGMVRVGLWHLNPAAVNAYLLPTSTGGSDLHVLAVAREGVYRTHGAREAATTLLGLVEGAVRPAG